MATIQYEFQTSASADELFRAVTTEEGFAAWWCRHCSLDSRLGGEAEFRFGRGSVIMAFQFDELEPARRVRMTCVRTQNNDEWQGTTLAFDLSTATEGGTHLQFRHEGWAEETTCYDQCVQGWGRFINSLQKYIETGTGDPYTDAT
jgi:uncharacterized protein YndB with AHSA1/START domain